MNLPVDVFAAQSAQFLHVLSLSTYGARIKKIMQTDEEVGKVAAAVPVIISRALELFVESLVRKASEITQTRNAKTLTTSHLKTCILADGQFHFLKELVADIPDVQPEDETSNPPILRQSSLMPARPRQPRQKKQKYPGEANAGPSQSTAEDTDTGSNQDDNSEEEASSGNTSDYFPPGSATFQSVPPTQTFSMTTNSDVNSGQIHFPCIQNCNATASSADDDDYDS